MLRIRQNSVRCPRQNAVKKQRQNAMKKIFLPEILSTKTQSGSSTWDKTKDTKRNEKETKHSDVSWAKRNQLLRQNAIKKLIGQSFSYSKRNKVFHMAQQIIPAAQRVPKYQSIGRCNNYVVLQSIPCSPECKIMGQILLDHPLSYALTAAAEVPLDTQEITYTVDMFRDTLHLPVETPDNPFIAPVNIEIIESFMQRLAIKTMFKVFNHCLTTQTSGHDQTKINILQLFHVVVNRTHVDYASLFWWDFINCVFQKKDVIQYLCFTKLIITNLMKKFPSIPQRIDEDYYSIKDDIPLLSVYTTGNVQGKKRKQTAEETSSPSKSLKVTIKQKQVVKEPGSHKEHPEVVNDDDKNEEEKKDEKKDDEMGSLEKRTEKTVSLLTATTSKDPYKKRRISSKYSHLPGALRRMCKRQGYMIKEKE
ncbi:hypothetical protein Tco_0967843 [Tanacetum coccineum]